MDCIDEFSTEGAFHSSGTFTLSAAEAKAKLSRFQLQPGMFLAKWVQAGVALGSQRIRIDLASHLRVTFVGSGSSGLRIDALMASLEDPLKLAPSTPEASLLFGILGSQSERTRPLTLQLKDPEGGVLIEILGEEARGRSVPLTGTDWSIQITLSDPHDLEVTLGVLRSRCSYSPIPIEFNGQALQSPWLQPAWGGYRLAEGFFSGDGPVRLNLPKPETRPCWCTFHQGQYRERSSSEPQAFLVSYPDEGEQDGWNAHLSISAQLQGRARVLWVKHGVIVEEEQIDLGTPGVVAIVSADFLETDLSQIQLLRNEVYQARVALLRDQASQLLRQVMACPLAVRAPVHVGKPLEDWVVASGGLAGLATLSSAAMPWNAPWIILGTVVVMGVDGVRRLMVRDAQESADSSRALQRRLDALRTQDPT